MKPGIYTDMPALEYHSDPCPEPSLSSSIARILIAESPLAAWFAHPRMGGGKKAATKAMDRGNVLDAMLVGGPATFAVKPAMMEDAKGKMVPYHGNLTSARQWSAEQLEAGKTIVSAEELETAVMARSEITKKLAGRGVTLKGTHQISMFWQEGNGIWARGRIDHLDGHIIDLKCSDDIRVRTLARKIFFFGMAIQAYAYLHALEVLGQPAAGFLWAFANPEPPFDVAVVPFTDEWKAIGRWQWETAVEKWQQCLTSGLWPGVDDGSERMIVPVPRVAEIYMQESASSRTSGDFLSEGIDW